MVPSDTPLSDKITALRESNTSEALTDFYSAFMSAFLGLVVLGLPPHAKGWYRVSTMDQVVMPRYASPDGRVMVRAAADPRVFARRHDPGINAVVEGAALLE